MKPQSIAYVIVLICILCLGGALSHHPAPATTPATKPADTSAPETNAEMKERQEILDGLRQKQANLLKAEEKQRGDCGRWIDKGIHLGAIANSFSYANPDSVIVGPQWPTIPYSNKIAIAQQIQRCLNLGQASRALVLLDYYGGQPVGRLSSAGDFEP
jgi:hypothetical protein